MDVTYLITFYLLDIHCSFRIKCLLYISAFNLSGYSFKFSYRSQDVQTLRAVNVFQTAWSLKLQTKQEFKYLEGKWYFTTISANFSENTTKFKVNYKKDDSGDFAQKECESAIFTCSYKYIHRFKHTAHWEKYLKNEF